ncbi:MAG: leucine--tRNA ligase, partial [SAR324 cluster bacterium]|nr:leucine--tRNA ligase [SAR324 cluster bacterium]
VEIEAKWQKSWEESGSFEPDFETEKSRYYMLTMLPYPSGDLHIGHWYAMAPSDTYARFLKMQGNEVFFPIGFDAFGLPAENAAIKNNIHPKDWTYKNIERMRLQLRSMGNMFAWKNEVVSCDPDYYKWSQWFFLRMLEMDLAYREFAPVDFCNHCQTTLAREQVWGDERLCERCGNTVIRKELNQWKLRITNYADELLDFDGLDWPERVRLMQTNWIGRSNGVEFDIELDLPGDLQFRVFTTRPDTVFGMTFCVLAPEHELVEQIVTDDQKEEVSIYCENAMRKDEIERMSESQEKDGVFTGAYAINPLNGDRVPVWVAEYVLAGYGTGAIMGVPAHDQRDFLFARRYDIPTPVVVVPEDHDQPIPEGSELEEALLVKEGSKMVNSNEFDGLVWPEGFDRVVQAIEDKGIGKKQINYRLRDWLISRQRMWGTPIPVIHCKNCGTVPVPYEDLPVMLPDDAEFKPTGESPLKYHPGFLNIECPKCGGSAERETDTMDTFICSSWYYYGYVSPYWKKGEKLKKEDLPWDPEAIKNWCPVNQYTGGIEHAT